MYDQTVTENIMIKEKKHTIQRHIFLGLVIVLLILPARYYTSYSLTLEVSSNLSVNYLNIIDIVACGIAFYCVFFLNTTKIDGWFIKIIGFGIMISIIDLCGLLFGGNSDFCSEIVSKSILLVCGVIITEAIINDLTDREKIAIYTIPLLILIMAPFFLRDYASYGETNRTGTLGFGSNETAMFACILIAIILLLRISGWIKLGIVLLCFASVLTVSSRRGILISAFILLIYAICFLFRRKETLTTRKFIWFGASAIVLCTLIIYIYNHYLDVIIDYISSSPLVIRLNYRINIGERAFDISDRERILGMGFKILNQHLFGGYYGSDKLFAQGSNTHNHNLLLQMLVIHGVIIGSIICIYFILTLYRAIYLWFFTLRNSSDKYSLGVIAVFFIIYFVFDMFGYLLWNPKGFIWIVTTTFIINLGYLQIKQNKFNTSYIEKA